MKIFTYFLLLVTLTCLSLIVFVLTQSGNFKITKTFELEAPQPIVYQYIQDLNNWNDWIETERLANGVYAITLPDVGHYQIRKEYEKPYDSISQDILYDAQLSNIVWHFSANGQKTKVTFSFEGTLDLQTKILSFFAGSPDQVVGKAIDKNINALIVFFIKQYKEYDLTTTGSVDRRNLSYIYLNATANYDDIKTTVELLNTQLTNFCTKHAIKVDPTPLLIFDNNPLTTTLDFQYGFKLHDSIFLNEEETFKTGTIEASSYFESTVNGYYAHLPKALREVRTIINKSEVFANNPNHKMIIELHESSLNNRLPSAWKTKILIPIIHHDRPVQNDSLTQALRSYFRKPASNAAKEDHAVEAVPLPVESEQ